MSDATRRALGRLVAHRHVTAAIVSGRRRRDLVRRVRLPRVQYWGLFGWERRQGCLLPSGDRATVARARGRLASAVSSLPGVRIEDKGPGFALHVRGARKKVERQARGLLRQTLARAGTGLHVIPGAKVWNVLPCQVRGKGAAVQGAVDRVRSPCLFIYVGDDATDEPAFAVLARGITVKVGVAGRTRAHYRLSNPDEVRLFMERLDQELS